MMDWTTNKPNARFWVLKLIKDNFHPGDKMVETDVGRPTQPTWTRRRSSRQPAASCCW